MSEKQDRHFGPSIMLFPLRKYMSTAQYSFIENNVKPGQSVLDLGCGPGFFTTALANAVGVHGTVYAVDGDEIAVAKLKKRAAERKMTNIKMFVSSAASIPFIHSEGVDILFSNGMLCCMTDHKGAVSEMVRVMKSGSKGFISISKASSKDGLGVSREEWKDIIGHFNILDSGSSIMMRWAIVSKIEPGSGQFSETVHSLEKEDGSVIKK